MAWNTAINLTSIRDPASIATRHVVDSLSATGILRERRIVDFIDLGSGGGFPGIPLALAVPATRALLVDSIGKKAAFLSAVVEAVGLERSVGVHAGRAEALAADHSHRQRWSGVTARAVGDLADLVEVAFPLLRPGGSLVAWKRGDLGPDLAAAERAVEATGGGEIELREVRLTGLDGHRLVILAKHGQTPAAYPRDPGARRNRPW
jgi:16S rRNA (guanine527-N7)-methyltransferase